MRILIADDDRVSRTLLDATLSRLGHERVSVADGQHAISALLEPGAPQLAILDWMMPGADGLDVCRAVRQRSSRYVYVILLTSRDQPQDIVEGLDAEADDFLTKPFNAIELRARLRSGERVLQLQDKLLHAHEALRHEAAHDRLTGLWNRGMILDQLSCEQRRAGRDGAPMAVMIADLDHFKAINDTHGHLAGDEVLRQAAERMRGAVRDYDWFGRYGGEEFVLLLPGCTASDALVVAERTRAALCASPISVGSLQLAITASFGVASIGVANDGLNGLLQAADEALYRAKVEGRNRVNG